MQSNFSSVDSLMTLHQFEEARKSAFEGHLKEKKLVDLPHALLFVL